MITAKEKYFIFHRLNSLMSLETLPEQLHNESIENKMLIQNRQVIVFFNTKPVLLNFSFKQASDEHAVDFILTMNKEAIIKTIDSKSDLLSKNHILENALAFCIKYQDSMMHKDGKTFKKIGKTGPKRKAKEVAF